jgi:hypothetical protein
MSTEFIAAPHVTFDLGLVKLVTVLYYGIVCQVHIFIIVVIRIIIYWRKSDVTLSINPNSKRVPICDKYPLSNIELFL